jgi:hypothetical protein
VSTGQVKLANVLETIAKALKRGQPTDSSGSDSKTPGTAPASTTAAGSPNSATQAPRASSAVDPHTEAKERLRKLTAWIIGVFGAVATIMVAGTQLGDLGALDSTTNVGLFGWHQTRFEFAVVGLGVMLGGAALAITLAAWVQVSSSVTLRDLAQFPEKPRRYMWLGWRVRARVREGIEGDLEQRGEVGAVDPATGRRSDALSAVIGAWGQARIDEHRNRAALLALEEDLADLRTPRPVNRCRLTGIRRGHHETIDWKDGARLRDLAQRLRSTTTLVEVPPAELQALKALEDQANETYINASQETTERFKLVNRVLQDASYLRLRLAFGMVLKYIVVAAVLAGVGIALFAWATHPPKIDPRNTAIAVVPAGTVTSLTNYLGSQCDASTLKIQIVGNAAVLSAASTSQKDTCTFKTSP